MARFNEILVGRYNRMLQKLLSMKGGPPCPQLATEIAPNISLFNGAENRYLEGWNRIGGRISALGVAANLSAGRLLNPAGSGVIAVVEKASVQASAAASVQLTVERPAGAGFPLVGSQMPFDSRNQTLAGSAVGGVCLVQGKNNNPTLFGIIVGSFGLLTGTQLELIQTDIQEIPLLPGDSLDMTLSVVNTNIDVTYWWRERVLEESERT